MTPRRLRKSKLSDGFLLSFERGKVVCSLPEISVIFVTIRTSPYHSRKKLKIKNLKFSSLEAGYFVSNDQVTLT